MTSRAVVERAISLWNNHDREGYIACFAITSAAGLEPVFRSSTHARRVRRATFSLQRRISSSRLFERKVCIMGRARQ